MPPTTPKGPASKGPLKPIKTLNLDQQLCTIRFRPDGRELAAGSFEAIIRRWDFSSDMLNELEPLRGHNGWVQSIAYHPKGTTLYAADSWGQLTAWDLQAIPVKPTWSVKDAHDGWIHTLTLSPDASLIATCGRDQTIRLTAATDGKEVRRIKHSEEVFSLVFHPDGKSLIAGDLKGRITHWELPTGKMVREFDAKVLYLKDRLQDVGGVRSLQFTADGKQLLAAGGQPKTGGFVQAIPTVLLFDWTKGEGKPIFKGSNDNEGFIFDMLLHPDGYLIAVTSGQPGQGKVLFQKLTDTTPFHSMALPNCHALAYDPATRRLVVSATNANSSGNGRVIGKNKEYPGNFSPVHLFEVQTATS